MPQLKIVLDTNALLRTVSRRSPFSTILDKLYNGAYDLYISNEIQLEYEEKISDIFSEETAELIFGRFHCFLTLKNRCSFPFKFDKCGCR